MLLFLSKPLAILVLTSTRLASAKSPTVTNRSVTGPRSPALISNNVLTASKNRRVSGSADLGIVGIGGVLTAQAPKHHR